MNTVKVAPINGPGQKAQLDNEIMRGASYAICIVGPNTLQNQLMSTYFENDLPAECVALNEFADFEWDGKPAEDKYVLLYDCMGKEADACLEECASLVDSSLNACLLCLFNMQKGTGVEERLLSQGVSGFFYLGDSFEQLVKGIKAVHQGEFWVSRRVMSDLITKNNHRPKKVHENAPSRREIEILEMIVEGASNEDIADKLCISKHTVKTHLYNIFKKLNVSSRFQAALWASKNL